MPINIFNLWFLSSACLLAYFDTRLVCLVSIFLANFLEKEAMKAPKMNKWECPLGDSTLCAVLSATPLLACTLLCLRDWLLHSSGSVAEVQSHLDHFTRGTKGAERSHWPCTRQAELYASLTSLVWHFSCTCPLPTPPCVSTTAVQRRDHCLWRYQSNEQHLGSICCQCSLSAVPPLM